MNDYPENTLNRDQKRRDSIIASYDPEFDNDPNTAYRGGIQRFSQLPLEAMEELITHNFIDVQDKQNNAPSIGQFIQFLRNHSENKFHVHGYAVGAHRSDYRISIEGICNPLATTMSPETVTAFIANFQNADEFDLEDGFCWYD